MMQQIRPKCLAQRKMQASLRKGELHRSVQPWRARIHWARTQPVRRKGEQTPVSAPRWGLPRTRTHWARPSWWWSPFAHWNSGLQPPQQAQAQAESRHDSLHSTRTTRHPAHLTDYFCYNARPTDPALVSTIAHSSQKVSSAIVIRYGLPHQKLFHTQFFSFSPKFRGCIKKVVEPKYF